MSISPVVQQAIDSYAKTEKTRSDIAIAVVAKQLDADKQHGQAVVELIEKAANVSRGIDVTV